MIMTGYNKHVHNCPSLSIYNCHEVLLMKNIRFNDLLEIMNCVDYTVYYSHMCLGQTISFQINIYFFYRI